MFTYACSLKKLHLVFSINGFFIPIFGHTYSLPFKSCKNYFAQCPKIDQTNLCFAYALILFFSSNYFSLQFYDLIERNPIAMANLKLRSLTIFAPTNEAFQKYTGSAVQVQYHMCKQQSVYNIQHHMYAKGPSQRFLSARFTLRHPLAVHHFFHLSISFDVHFNQSLGGSGNGGGMWLLFVCNTRKKKLSERERHKRMNQKQLNSPQLSQRVLHHFFSKKCI